mmetsp:Transcript_33012/g.72806  ORF Transcript_33012/g.72806 Transcript_33012/m.72806 type:complete len:157 (+) Transcript_33012:1240-1710(+)
MDDVGLRCDFRVTEGMRSLDVLLPLVLVLSSGRDLVGFLLYAYAADGKSTHLFLLGLPVGDDGDDTLAVISFFFVPLTPSTLSSSQSLFDAASDGVREGILEVKRAPQRRRKMQELGADTSSASASDAKERRQTVTAIDKLQRRCMAAVGVITCSR